MQHMAYYGYEAKQQGNKKNCVCYKNYGTIKFQWLNHLQGADLAQTVGGFVSVAFFL